MASILNNVSALGATRQLGITNTGLNKTIERLTSGKRINRASDDAAGLATANTYASAIKSDGQGRRNVNDALSSLQTQDGLMEEVTNLLQRGVEIASTNGASSNQAVKDEWNTIQTTVTALMSQASFGGSTVQTSATLASVSAGSFGVKTFTATVPVAAATTLVADTPDATSATTMLGQISSLRGGLGAAMQSLTSYGNALGIQVENKTAQMSQIVDANIGEEVVNLSKFQILNQSGISALSQANQAGQSILSLLR